MEKLKGEIFKIAFYYAFYIVFYYVCVSLKKITSEQTYHYLTCWIDLYPNLNHTEGVVRRARGRSRALEAWNDFSKKLITPKPLISPFSNFHSKSWNVLGMQKKEKKIRYSFSNIYLFI